MSYSNETLAPSPAVLPARLPVILICLALAVFAASCACGRDDSSDDDAGISDDDSTDDDIGDDDADDDSGFDDDVDDDSADDDTEPAPPWVEPTQPLREDISLDGTWLFTPEGYAEREVGVPCHWEAIDEWDGWEPFTCPEYLAGTPDEHVSIIEGQNWEDRAIKRGTYRRAVTLDKPWPVVRAYFEAIHHAGEVWWNDAPVGETVGAYRPATFDASAVAHEGENELRVELEDGHALLGPDGITRWPAGYYAHNSITGLYRSVTLQLRPDIVIEDVFLVPSTRREDLTIQVTIRNTREVQTSVWVLGRAMDADGVLAMESPATRVAIPAGGTREVVIVAPFADARWWWPTDPHLYTWRTLLIDEFGAPVDLREDRFGFREVWIEGGRYKLNGETMNLIGDSIDDQASRPRYWGPQYWDCDTAPATIERIKDLYFNVVRFHQAPPPDCVYDMLDEAGLLVIPESPVYARIDIMPPFFWKPLYVENSWTWIGEWARRLRNHPSIVMWSVENEMFMYAFPLSPQQAYSLGVPARAADTIVRPDGPTTPRPINWDGDTSFFRNFFGMNPETINWHYPAGPNLTITPDNEWYDDAIANFEPYKFDDVPTGVGETMDVRRPEWILRTADQAKAMQGIAVRALRYLGYSDIRPYKLNWTWHIYRPDGSEHPFGPWYHSLFTQEQKDGLIEIIRDSYHPIAAIDVDYTRVATNPDGTQGPVEIAAGSGVSRKLAVFNDSFLPGRDQTLRWTVTDETASVELASDEIELSIEHGNQAGATAAFTAPAAGHDVTLRIESEMDGLPQGVYEIEYAFVTTP